MNARATIAVLLVLVSFAGANPEQSVMRNPVFYRTIKVDGLTIFYREAGPRDRLVFD